MDGHHPQLERSLCAANFQTLDAAGDCLGHRANRWLGIGMRGMMVTVEGEDYMTFAEAKGLKAWRLFFRYGCECPASQGNRSGAGVELYRFWLSSGRTGDGIPGAWHETGPRYLSTRL